MWSLNGERPARSQIKRSLIRLPTIFYLKILIQRESKADKHIVGSAWRSRTVWSVCGGKISAKIHKTNAKIASFSLIVREQERPATPLFGPYHHRKARFTLRRAQPLRIHTGERKTGGFEVSSASVLDSLAIAEANIGGGVPGQKVEGIIRASMAIYCDIFMDCYGMLEDINTSICPHLKLCKPPLSSEELSTNQ